MVIIERETKKIQKKKKGENKMVAEVIEGGVLCRARRDTLYTHEHGQPGRVRTPLLTDCCRPEATRNPPISPITR
jgi:hypothetical protein